MCKFSHGVFFYLVLTLCCVCGVWDFDILVFRNSINRERHCTCIVVYGRKAYIRRSISIYSQPLMWYFIIPTSPQDARIGLRSLSSIHISTQSICQQLYNYLTYATPFICILNLFIIH